MHMGLSELRELIMDREACWNSWGRKESDMTEQLNNILSSTVAYQLMMLLHIGFTEKEQVTID